MGSSLFLGRRAEDPMCSLWSLTTSLGGFLVAQASFDLAILPRMTLFLF